MADRSYLYWEPEWEPEGEEEEEEPRPRDPVIDEAKEEIRTFFAREPTGVFYKQQLEVIFEKPYFHWITSRALSELVGEKYVAAELESLPGTGAIIFYHQPSHRYWRRQAHEIIALVAQFSEPVFTAALGAQGETLF